MDPFYVIVIFLAGTLLAVQLYLIVNERRKIKNKKQGIIKLEEFMSHDIYMIIIGIVFAAGSFFKITTNIYEFAFLFLMGMSALIQGFRQKKCYINVDANGFKESNYRKAYLYTSVRFKWELITEIRMSKSNPTEMLFGRNGKIRAIDFNSRERIDEFKTQVKTFSPKTYELFLSNV